MPVKPKRLEKGMTIGLIAPASAPGKKEYIDKGIRVLERIGFKCKLGRNALAKEGYLAGTDKQRVDDIHAMFEDPEIDAIMCLRGGYGTPRILPLIDYDLVKNKPKIFVGFSDITALHAAFSEKSNLVCFHGPMVTSNFAHETGRKYSLGSLIRMLSENKAFGSILHGSGIKKAKTLRGGKSSGALCGGNLSLVVTLIGTPWEINFKDKIVFLEEVGEEVYRVDRMLTQLLNTGELDKAAGIVFGQFNSCTSKPTSDERPTQTLTEILQDRMKNLQIPIAYGFPFGHDSFTATLPVGIRATLNADKGDLIIEESAVQ